MGRTLPTFRMLLDEIITELSAFRRALRGEDKVAFDSIMNKARSHSSSSTIAPMLDPMDAMMLSVLIEMQKEINSLKETKANVPAGCQVRSENRHDHKMD